MSISISNFKCKLMLGDTEEVLKQFPDNTFHTAITSPPYWAQRDYKVEGQLGQEETPEEYVERLVAICEEVRRTLREDGTFWLNIGDGYCKKTIKSSNLKQKDLVGIPWMVAFALKKAGWYLRNEIIWNKLNPQPDSSKDRCAKSHEHVFLLSKSPNYFYDWYGVSVPQKEISIKRAGSKNKVEKRKDYGDDNYAISGESQEKRYKKMREELATLKDGDILRCNRKDVWTLATASGDKDDSKTNHFAIFPQEIVMPCIVAGSSTGGCCSKCQTPLVRKEKSIEFEFSCDCGIGEVKECIVLDPFNGSGTTGKVCKANNRKYVGIDINEDYLNDTREHLGGGEKDMFSQEAETVEEFIKL